MATPRDTAPGGHPPAVAPTNSGALRLTVGPNIKLKGAEINDCDTLVVEGTSRRQMDSKTLEILKTGSTPVRSRLTLWKSTVASRAT